MYLVYCMETKGHNISYVCIENVCTNNVLSVLLCNVCVCYVYILKMSKKIKRKKRKKKLTQQGFQVSVKDLHRLR